MKFPKVTNSKDGKKRMTVNIEFRVNQTELAIALGELLDQGSINWNHFTQENIGNFLDKNVKKEILKADVYKKLKETLQDCGDLIWTRQQYWVMNNLNDDVLKWCEDTVKELFPEFDS